MDALQTRLSDSTQQQLEAQRKVAGLVERVEKAETLSASQSQQLATQNQNLASLAGGKVLFLLVSVYLLFSQKHWLYTVRVRLIRLGG